MSEFIKELEPVEDQANEYQRISQLITKGDELRERFGASVISEKAIEKISKYRLNDIRPEAATTHGERVAFIIDSIKNQAEMDLFEFIYRQECYCIGAFSPLSQRLKYLTDSGSGGMSEQNAYSLIELDAGETAPKEKRKFSQTVQKTFAKADLFLRMDTKSTEDLEKKLLKFLHLIFKTKVITPTPGEAAMYAAASSALNSGCLSRQVGACITNSKGELLSVGWNDVPAPMGGLYNCTTIEDMRCFNFWLKCQNTIEKEEIIENIQKDLDGNKLFNKTAVRKILYDSKIQSLIEFCRAVHAEMYAIIQAGNKGISVKGGSLYCTTYPCHGCARHIVAAGINNVYYIEPYTKSLAIHLHEDSITENEKDQNKVRFLAFDGVAPNRYRELFSQQDRKDQEEIPTDVVKPKNQISLEAIPALESIVVTQLNRRLEKANEGKQTALDLGGPNGTTAA